MVALQWLVGGVVPKLEHILPNYLCDDAHSQQCGWYSHFENEKRAELCSVNVEIYNDHKFDFLQITQLISLNVD